MFFNFLFFFYALFYFPYLLVTGRWYKGYGCRFGVFPQEINNRLQAHSSIWIHAVSVGEIMAIAPLTKTIQSRYPQDTLVVTVTTKTGYELAKSKLASSVVVLPSPLDFTWVVSSFIRLIKPKVYIAAETEIWPNLFHCLFKRDIPVVIINGRISDVSFGRYKAIKFFLENILKKVSFFCMQSKADAGRILELGAPQDKVRSVGNIKFDDISGGQESALQLPLAKDRLLWVAGSTHPGEEEIVLDIFNRYKDVCDLVIAPRHVERSGQITALIESQGFKAVRFSQLSQAPLSTGTVIVVDTIGHLRSLYSKASFVFVGKSLCVGGGHNIIEPAVYAKPVITGPMMENFRDITALFKAQGAIVQIQNAQELEQEVERLIRDKDLRKQLGQKALAVVKDNQGALERTVQLLSQWI